MIVIARLEYELAYYDSAVHRFNHYTTRTPPCLVSVRWHGILQVRENHLKLLVSFTSPFQYEMSLFRRNPEELERNCRVTIMTNIRLPIAVRGSLIVATNIGLHFTVFCWDKIRSNLLQEPLWPLYGQIVGAWLTVTFCYWPRE